MVLTLSADLSRVMIPQARKDQNSKRGLKRWTVNSAYEQRYSILSLERKSPVVGDVSKNQKTTKEGIGFVRPYSVARRPL